MNEMKPISNFRNNLYQVAIILLLAYAAFSSAMKDLDRLQNVAGSVQSATTNGLGGLAKVYSATRSLAAGEDLDPETKAGSITAAPQIDIVAAGGSVALAGLDRVPQRRLTANEIFAADKIHNKLSCPVRKNESLKSNEKDFNWDVVAQAPKRVQFLRHEIPVERDAEHASLIRRGQRLSAVISKLPQPGKSQWSNVDEFKSLSDLIGLGFKVVHTQEAETERTETTEDASRYVFEIKRGVTDSERDDLETHE